MCSLLSLLYPSAACSRRSESAPAPSEVQPRWSLSPPSSELPSSELPSSELPSSELPSSELPSSELPSFDRGHVFSVGQPAPGAGYVLQVRRVLECSGRDGWRPAPQRLFLGVELEVTAGDESVAIGHSHVKLGYGQGHTIAAEPFVKTENCEPLLKYTRLAAHERLQGWIVFSLPETATSLELRVKPRQFLHDQALSFDLGR